MTSAQVVETSLTNNSSFQNYTHPDDHTIRTKVEEVHKVLLHEKRKHKPFESISQVSGKEVAIRAIAAHEESKRRSKSVHPKQLYTALELDPMYSMPY